MRSKDFVTVGLWELTEEHGYAVGVWDERFGKLVWQTKTRDQRFAVQTLYGLADLLQALGHTVQVGTNSPSMKDRIEDYRIKRELSHLN